MSNLLDDKYSIYLAKNNESIRDELSKYYDICPCCIGDDDVTIWLRAFIDDLAVSIHGAGYPLEGFEKFSPQDMIQFQLDDVIKHNGVVIITSTVADFMQAINRRRVEFLQTVNSANPTPNGQ